MDTFHSFQDSPPLCQSGGNIIAVTCKIMESKAPSQARPYLAASDYTTKLTGKDHDLGKLAIQDMFKIIQK